MSRNPDIRVDLVNTYPQLTIAQLSKVVDLVTAVTDSSIIMGLTKVEHVVSTTVNETHVGFSFTFDSDSNKLGVLGKVYSMTSLQEFSKSLQLMSGPMGLGERTFSTLYYPIYSELKSMTLSDKEIAALIVSAYSGIMKRWHNKNRAGANNDYRFKLKLSTVDRPVTFTIKNLNFNTPGKAKFNVESSNEVLNEILNWNHETFIPTPEAASIIIGNKIKSDWGVSEEKKEDKPMTFQELVRIINRHRKAMSTGHFSSDTSNYLYSFLDVLRYADDYFTDAPIVNWYTSFGKFKASEPKTRNGKLVSRVEYCAPGTNAWVFVNLTNVDEIIAQADEIFHGDKFYDVIPQRGSLCMDLSEVFDDQCIGVLGSLEADRVMRELVKLDLTKLGDYAMDYINDHWFEFTVINSVAERNLVSLRVDSPDDIESTYYILPLDWDLLRSHYGYVAPVEEPVKKPTLISKFINFFKKK